MGCRRPLHALGWRVGTKGQPVPGEAGVSAPLVQATRPCCLAKLSEELRGGRG